MTAEPGQDRAHWDGVYGRGPSEELGWYEPGPSTLALVTGNADPHESVIDVGAGDSRLVDALVERGQRDITVLDLSAVALDRARRRLGARADIVDWIRADVTEFEPLRTWDLWHDRAVFHFLVSDERRAAYRNAAARALAPGGRLVIATFGPDGPEQCAGLPVCRYDLDSLPAALAPEFEALAVAPLSPGPAAEGDQRPYIGAVFTRAQD